MQTILTLSADPHEDIPVVRHRDDLKSSYIEIGAPAGWTREDGTPHLRDNISIAIDGSRENRADFLDQLIDQLTSESLRLRAVSS